MSDYKKAFLKGHIEKLLKESNEAMLKKIDKVIASGAIDIDGYDTENNPMILPKAITIALLETEASQYDAKGTSFEKQIKKEVKNIKYFI